MLRQMEGETMIRLLALTAFLCIFTGCTIETKQSDAEKITRAWREKLSRGIATYITVNPRTGRKYSVAERDMKFEEVFGYSEYFIKKTCFDDLRIPYTRDKFIELLIKCEDAKIKQLRGEMMTKEEINKAELYDSCYMLIVMYHRTTER